MAADWWQVYTKGFFIDRLMENNNTFHLISVVKGRPFKGLCY